MTWGQPTSSHVPRFTARTGRSQGSDPPEETVQSRYTGFVHESCTRSSRAQPCTRAVPRAARAVLRMRQYRLFQSGLSQSSPSNAFVFDQRQASCPARGRGKSRGRQYANKSRRSSFAPEEISAAPGGDCSFQCSVAAVDNSFSVQVTQRSSYDPNRLNAFIADVNVNGIPLHLLTVSHVSILDKKTFQKVDLKGNIMFHPPARRLVHYMQGTIPIIRCFTGQFTFKNKFALLKFYVIPSGCTLFGIDAVRELKLKLSGADYDCAYITV